MEKVGLVVVGAGVIGSAIAAELSAGKEDVLVLEAASKPGDETTGRNSGVIHAGLYYSPNSLKATTCIRGNALLYDWCIKHRVAHNKCGKLIVAKNEKQEEVLSRLFSNAKNAQAKGVSWLDQKALSTRFPEVPGRAALWSSETGIVDPIELTNSLIAKAQRSGAVLVTDARVSGIAKKEGGFLLTTSRGEVWAERVVNCAGLFADDLARMVGTKDYQIFPCRGDYFVWNTKRKFPFLIYPVKDPESSHLGIHVTFDSSGRVRLGPNATYVNYKTYDQPSSKHLKEEFLRAGRALFGDMNSSELSYDGYGLRPKLRGPEEKEDRDFVISEDIPGFVNLIGIDSPGLTACLSIAEEVSRILRSR